MLIPFLKSTQHLENRQKFLFFKGKRPGFVHERAIFPVPFAKNHDVAGTPK